MHKETKIMDKMFTLITFSSTVFENYWTRVFVWMNVKACVCECAEHLDRFRFHRRPDHGLLAGSHQLRPMQSVSYFHISAGM